MSFLLRAAKPPAGTSAPTFPCQFRAPRVSRGSTDSLHCAAVPRVGRGAYRCVEARAPRQIQPPRTCSTRWSRVPQIGAQVRQRAPRVLCASRREFEAVKVDPALRRRVEDGISELGFRVTVGDLAGHTGLPLDDIKPALLALASDCLAQLEVSDDGEIVFAFPTDFRARLRNEVLRVKLEPVVDKTKAVVGYLARVLFGTTLLASVIAVWLAIYVVLNSSSNSNERSRSESRGGSQYFGGPIFNVSDIFWYWNPWYVTRTQERRETGREMSFFESIFSFVFGDGDPNFSYEDAKWAQLGSYISARGGVVTAEEMAPFVVTSSSEAEDSADESYVLPAISRFAGEITIDDEGQILYEFPSFQISGKESPRGLTSRNPYSAVYEKKVEFTAASKLQIFGTVVLCALNASGLVFLTSLLQDPSAQLALSQSSLSVVLQGLPFLQAGAAAFCLIPFFRYLLMLRSNSDIEKRNNARSTAAQRVSEPDAMLRRKLRSARAASKVKVMRGDEAYYRTDRDLAIQEDERRAAEVDRRLAELDS